MALIEIENGCWSVSTTDAPEIVLSVTISDNRLEISFGNASVALSDSVRSGWLHAGNGGNLNPALRTVDGEYPLYSTESEVEEDHGTGYHVVRIRTPLKDKKDGHPLPGAFAHTDVIMLFASRTAVVLTFFETTGYTPFREISICRASLVSGSVFMALNGESRKLTEEPLSLVNSNYVCRDLSEFGRYNPFITAFSKTETVLPEIRITNSDTPNSSINNGNLAVDLAFTGRSLGLIGIRDTEHTEIFYHPSQAEPLFSLLLHDLETGSDFMLTSLSEWNRVSREDEDDVVCFRFFRSGLLVYLTAVLSPSDHRITWQADVRLTDLRFSLIRFDPPSAGMNIDKDQDIRVFFALGPGSAIPMRGEFRTWHPMIPYPSIGVCMQYFAFYDNSSRRGIYCGYHDPRATYKLLHADCQNGVCSCGALIPAEGMDTPANDFTLGGGVVWQLFDGDWYDATLIYRDFVMREALWFRDVPAKARDDVPKWLYSMPAWFRSDANHDGWMEHLFEAQDDLGGIPVGVHAYQWHEIPFDTNYPHYKPAKAEFVSKLPVMQARGLKVMPYINGRLWDTHDRGDYDYQFTALAKPWAAKGRGGEVITERYNSKNSRGEPVELAVMCPSSALWQEKQQEINDWILNDLGADAVYVDQIAAAPPVVCMDRTHAHRPGGGSWWYEHYYNLLEHLNQVAGKDKCYTTESNAEPFVGHIGGMLVWHWVGGFQVPAFSVIYSRYEPMLGRNYGVLRTEDAAGFRVLTAQSLCFGDQPGWMTPEMYLANPARAFFREVAVLRWKYRDYFTSGFCRRPPRLKGDVGEFALPFGSNAVLSAMWEIETGKKLVIVVNASDTRRTVDVFPDGEEEFCVSLAPESIHIREI